jgi:membrane-associated phospholipid phosphatase
MEGYAFSAEISKYLMQKILAVTLLVWTFGTGGIFSQTKSTSPYRLDWRKELPTLVLGTGMSAAGHFLEQGIQPRTEEEIAALTLDNPLGIDKDAVRQYSPQAGEASDWLLGSSFALPLTLMIDRDIRTDAGKISILLSESFFLTVGVTSLTKRAVLRDRPYVFNSDVSIERKLSPDAQLSFFSGHTSVSACFSFFTAKVWSDYHPDSKLRPLVWTAAATLPAITGYLRYRAGKHYLTDVATGYAIGALVGYFVPHWHKIDRRSRRKLRFSSALLWDAPVVTVKYRF